MLFAQQKKPKHSRRPSLRFGGESLENRNLMTGVGFEGGLAATPAAPEIQGATALISETTFCEGDHDIPFDPDGDLQQPQVGDSEGVDDLNAGEETSESAVVVQVRIKVKHSV